MVEVKRIRIEMMDGVEVHLNTILFRLNLCPPS
jgi:hypothetical protein